MMLAVCSRRPHHRQNEAAANDSDSDTGIDDRGLTIDLYTSECPIEVTVHNKDETLAATGLYDCAVNGVLTIFAVQRIYSTTDGQSSTAISEKQYAWEHPLGQSDRGFANLLSTLRTFTDITSGRSMDEGQQDAILRILHLMTRLPPAVRAAYVLMRGETPRPSECAALPQALYEILKEVVSLAIISNDPLRFFEGTRFLFGLILSKAKRLRVNPPSDSATGFPYTRMRVLDLRNAITMLLVRGIPLQSKAGLIDTGLLHTKRTSPLTNMQLAHLDLRSDIQAKQKLGAYLQGTDVYTPQSNAQTVLISIKSPLGSWTKDLPNMLTLRDLYALAFRSTKGHHVKFEMCHKNAVLPWSSAHSIGNDVTPGIDVFITPVEEVGALPTNAMTGAMCLVKVYSHWGYSIPVCSYWEPKTATKTLSSVVFRYYRHKFPQYAYTAVDAPFVIWHNLYSTGDNNRGSVTDHWNAFTQFFNYRNATGTIHEESMVDPPELSGGLHAAPSGPLVLKLTLGSVPSKSTGERKTLEADTHVGLVTFGTTATVSQNVTHAIENFRHQLNNMVANGDTAIWNSIALAIDQLQQYASKYPKTKLRIICISDGEDNKSTRLVHDLAWQLVGSNIVVDSLCLGNTNNDALQTLSYMTGGYKFQPESLEEAMAICEMEPVLSILERPTAELPRNSSRHAGNSLYRFQQARRLVTIDHATRDSFPQRPPESTYAGGTFLTRVSSPPSTTLNINHHGRICHSIFDRNWTIDTTTKDLVDTIYSLLLLPEFSDPINTVVTLNCHWDEVQFKEEAQRHIRKHAAKTRAAWRLEITGLDMMG
ncbi:hypothetical protein E8E11_000526 [Didymella keratinophila]|nr:hypothetical protein E8E11_000526 [Didymella keratinophila]